MTLRNKVETPEQRAAMELVTLAEEAKTKFRTRDFEAALKRVNLIIERSPENGDALQFRSLVNFAMRNYPAAAADAYDALALSPVWTREAVDTLYSSAINYGADLKRLETDTQQHPTSLAHHFLGAYHAIIQGDLARSEQMLTKMLELAPNEPVATQLLAAVRQKAGLGNQTVAGQ